MNKRCRIIISLLLISSSIIAQQDSIKKLPELNMDLSFISYLLDNEETDDAIFLMDNIKKSGKIQQQSYTDSLNFLSGMAWYQKKKLENSFNYLSRVSPQSTLFEKSRYYAGFELIYQKKLQPAKEFIKSIPFTDSLMHEYRLMQLAAISLLNKNVAEFDSLSSKFRYNNVYCLSEQRELMKYRDRMASHKKKSPLVAGLMSAIVPGTGKFYAGYRGQAVSAFIPSFIFGAVAVENYLKGGLRSPQFIIAAGLFSIYYIGNIWGSVVSVRTYSYRFYDEINHNIMLDLHIPLRRIFNQ
jgi:hypothetical protein